MAPLTESVWWYQGLHLPRGLMAVMLPAHLQRAFWFLLCFPLVPVVVGAQLRCAAKGSVCIMLTHTWLLGPGPADSSATGILLGRKGRARHGLEAAPENPCPGPEHLLPLCPRELLGWVCVPCEHAAIWASV